MEENKKVKKLLVQIKTCLENTCGQEHSETGKVEFEKLLNDIKMLDAEQLSYLINEMQGENKITDIIVYDVKNNLADRICKKTAKNILSKGTEWKEIEWKNLSEIEKINYSFPTKTKKH